MTIDQLFSRDFKIEYLKVTIWSCVVFFFYKFNDTHLYINRLKFRK